MDLISYADSNAKEKFVESLHTIGFAIVINHPIGRDLLSQVSKDWQEFFARPQKFDYLVKNNSQSGFFPAPPKPEKLGDGQLRDRKEFFQMQLGDSSSQSISSATNVLLDLGFSVATQFLHWLGSATNGLKYTEMIKGSTGTTLRLQHYLPIDETQEPNFIRALEHKDLNLLTLLPAPTSSGLQVKTTGGQWLDVPDRDDILIVNAGCMLEAASHGYFPATPHRVINTAQPENKASRFSFPLFVHPRSNVKLVDSLSAGDFLAEQVSILKKKGWAVQPGGSKN